MLVPIVMPGAVTELVPLPNNWIATGRPLTRVTAPGDTTEMLEVCNMAFDVATPSVMLPVPTTSRLAALMTLRP